MLTCSGSKKTVQPTVEAATLGRGTPRRNLEPVHLRLKTTAFATGFAKLVCVCLWPLLSRVYSVAFCDTRPDLTTSLVTDTPSLRGSASLKQPPAARNLSKRDVASWQKQPRTVCVRGISPPTHDSELFARLPRTKTKPGIR